MAAKLGLGTIGGVQAHSAFSGTEHDALDMYELSKVSRSRNKPLTLAQPYNLVNTTGSATVVIFSSIAVVITWRLAKRRFDLISTYRVPLAYFAGVTLLTSIPFFVFSARRPGQPFPKHTKLWTLGPK